MHTIDDAILNGSLTSELLGLYTKLPLPAPGVSYWGDRMRECGDALQAAKWAAHDMGTAFTSIAAMTK